MWTVRFSYNLAASYLQNELDVYESQEVESKRVHPILYKVQRIRVVLTATFRIDLQLGRVCLLYVATATQNY